MDADISATIMEESRKQRLMISNMTLENFKSYAGEQEIGPFHKRFSSIVGPNGSGKSNVIDAMLFVFGKKAKQLRLNKVAELIHRSKNFPDLQYARVTVYFQMIYEDDSDSDEYEVVPNSQFVVCRTAYKDSTSKYQVNGKTSTYTEVGKLLRRVGIDLDNNRFLILQGEVEQIAMMKPKGVTQHDEGLLEYLEDIIGTVHFVDSIAEVGKRLDACNEERTAKLNLVRLSERERDNLQDSRDEAQAYIDAERNVRRKQNHMFQAHALEASKTMLESKAKCEAVSSALAEEKEKLSGTDKELCELKQTFKATSDEYDNVCTEVSRATKELTSFERRDVKLQEDLKHTRATLKKLQTGLARDAKKEQDSEEQAEAARAEVERLAAVTEKAVSDHTEAETALDDVMAGLQEATSALRAELEAVQEQLVDAKRAVSGLETEKEGVQQQLSLSQARHTKAAKGLVKAQEKLEAVRTELAGCEARLAGADGEHARATAEVDTLSTELARLHALEKDLTARVRAAVSAVEEGKAAMQSSASGRSGALEVILKAARKGGPLASCGVRGRLGDLGSISEKYDVAISTACGALDNIVVDTTAGAQRCVSFLRENNAGRASFLVLEKQTDPARRMLEPKQLPKGCPRLFDLVQTEERYKPAFYMALRDTLVASDLDTAVGVAFEGGKAKWRVVTTDGNLVDTSGAMSGGGKSVKSGGMRAKPVAATACDMTAAKLQQLEVDAANCTDALARCRRDKNSASSGLDAAKKRIKQLGVTFEKARIATQSLGEQVAQLEERTTILATEVKPTAEEEAVAVQLAARLHELDEQMDRESPTLRDLETDVAARQKAILAVGGPKLKAAQKCVSEAADALDRARTLASAKEVECATASKAAVKAAAAAKKGQKDVEVAEARLEELSTEQKTMEDEAMGVVEAVNKAKAMMKEREQSLAVIREKYEKTQAEVEKARSGVVDLETQLEEAEKMIMECTAQEAHWRGELAALREVWEADQAEEIHRRAAFEEVERAAGVYEAPVIAHVKAPAADTEVRLEAVAEDVEAESTPEGTICEEDQAEAEAEETTKEKVEEIEKDSEVAISSEAEAEAEALIGQQTMVQVGLEDLIVYTEETVGNTTARRLEELKKAIISAEKERDRLKETVNLSALAEYHQKTVNYRLRVCDLETSTERRNECRREHEDLRRQRLEAFMTGFNIITLKLKEMYQMITLGGDAELELVDSLDPFSEGIVFSVRPPKKSWKNISNLSGGEKTLSSLALVFALHHYKPTPLYVMDEIDAALDFKNVSIVANYIKERTKNAQFVIISLRNNMFELADRLVGIYKTHDATKSITINPRTFDQAVSGAPPAHNALAAVSPPPSATLVGPDTPLKAAAGEERGTESDAAALNRDVAVLSDSNSLAADSTVPAVSL